MEVDFGDEPSPPVRNSKAPFSVQRAHPADEEWVGAVPVVAKRETRVNGNSHGPEPKVRELPHSIEAEQYLLSCCFIDGKSMVLRCRGAKVKAATFYNESHAIVFACIESCADRNLEISTEVVAEELRATKQLDGIGGENFLSTVSKFLPTTAQAGYFIQKVRAYALLRETVIAASSMVESAHNFSGDDIEDFLQEQQARLKRIASNSEVSKSDAHPITSFRYPTADDPSILLGSDDYLGRGGGMLFVSHAGAGKSSWIMDACMSWAIGTPWMGIRCNGKLKSLIVQAEDSPRYIGKVTGSFIHARKLDLVQQQKLGENCIMVRLKGVSGPSFFAELRRLVEKHQPDLVVINPIYLYAEGDIGRSEFAQPFLVGLDDINRDEKFGYILIHHTGKPQQKDKNGARNNVEDWESVYMGFGSSYLANWPRCSALLEPVPNANGRYLIKLGKGGLNAGVTKEVEQGAGVRHEPTTRIAIRHSKATIQIGGRDRPEIYWEIDPEKAPAEESGDKTRGAGRPPKFDFSDYRNIFPPKSGPGMLISPLHRHLMSNGEIPKKTLHMVLKRWAEDGFVEIMRPEGKPTQYRCAV